MSSPLDPFPITTSYLEDLPSFITSSLVKSGLISDPILEASEGTFSTLLALPIYIGFAGSTFTSCEKVVCIPNKHAMATNKYIFLIIEFGCNY